MASLPTPSRRYELSPDATARALERLEAAQRRRIACNRLAYFQPYPKQLDFYALGLIHRERLLMAANQVGKTFGGAFEVAVHLTGRYPDWWPGRRFNRPVRAWAGSDTTETTRDTVQTNLLGPPASEEDWGTGAIPKDALVSVDRRQGVANAVDTVLVRHVSGEVSQLGFKSYDQGRQKWQGSVRDLVWMDEEPPLPIYTEAKTRTNTVDDGLVMLTFTPLLGPSEVVMQFLDDQDERGAVSPFAGGRTDPDRPASTVRYS